MPYSSEFVTKVDGPEAKAKFRLSDTRGDQAFRLCSTNLRQKSAEDCQ